MILLIDIGNTCIKWTTLQAGSVLPSSRYYYTSEEMVWDWLETVVPVPEAIYTISVGSEVVGVSLTKACRDRWGITPVKLQTGSYSAGLRNGYDNPMTLGVDRWAAMLGAYQLTQGAVLVIDCGTACSADLVDAFGRHLGGGLIPGLLLMQQGLRSGTARIETEGALRSATGLGTTTSGCIQFGATAAVLGFIERMGSHAATILGASAPMFITGGGAPELLALLPRHVRYEKELVFLGMAVMLRETGE